MPISGAPRTLARLPGGALWRSTYPSEAEWFAHHLSVAGFATRQGEVVLNPYLARRPKQRRSVLLNEATRVYLWRRKSPRIWLNPEQKTRFASYGRIIDQVHTVIARLVAADPSAGRPSAAQRRAACQVSRALGLAASYAVASNLREQTVRLSLIEPWRVSGVGRPKGKASTNSTGQAALP